MLMLVFIIISGGLQDAYSYFCRDGVFANAQTGNIVFLSVNIVNGDMAGVLKYLVPIAFFALGAILAKTLFFLFEKRRIFWKQMVLLVETAALFAVGFMPSSMNLYANALVSFACAMQVLSFDQIYGNDFASTMCIGNIVRMSGSLVTAIAKKDKTALKRFGLYLTVVVIFGIGAGAGYLLQKYTGNYAIMFSALLTFVASFAFIGKEKRAVDENDRASENDGANKNDAENENGVDKNDCADNNAVNNADGAAEINIDNNVCSNTNKNTEKAR